MPAATRRANTSPGGAFPRGIEGVALKTHVIAAMAAASLAYGPDTKFVVKLNVVIVRVDGVDVFA